MARAPSYRDHLESAKSLVTTYEHRRAGFVAMALERSRRAIPHIAQARALKAMAERIANPSELIDTPEIRDSLVAAAGISDKAGGHFGVEDKVEAIKGLIRDFLKPAGKRWVEELVYRFLLTRGDSLGGELRNIAGSLGQKKFAQAIIGALSLQRNPFDWREGKSREWLSSRAGQPDPDASIKAICWRRAGQNRVLVYNARIPLVDKNIDMSLLNADVNGLSEAQREPARYLAIGELKGGIDPAGADEHWKTARAAIVRVRTSFAGHEHSPKLFFIGAAIENSMAEEIWTQLTNESLANAANLTDEDQLASFCQWIVSL